MKKEVKSIFGAELRRARLAAGLTQEELSFRSDVTDRYIRDLEAGTKTPTLSVLFKLSDALDTAPDKLIMSAWKMYKK